MTLYLLAVPAILIWLTILILPWRPWSTRESLDSDPAIRGDLSDITVLIPARNEVEVIGETLHSLRQQDEKIHVVLVNDQSEDETVAVAKQSGLENLVIVDGKALPDGWSGKLWALEQGRAYAQTTYLLLLDADIKLTPGIVSRLLAKMEDNRLDMVSLMAFLRMQTHWEKMLIPAFIYFFKLLYPFHLSNSPESSIAAAAGGCILIRKEVLQEVGGFEAIRDELIDDCALAKKIKKNGGKTWTGLTHSAISLRHYDTLKSIWDMVARTAFTQLRYSIVLLFLCTILMLLCFLVPVICLFSPVIWVKITALVTLLIMYISYLPTLKYYSVSFYWCLFLPVTGFIYLLMTWTSAYHHYFKHGAHWKNRHYAIPE